MQDSLISQLVSSAWDEISKAVSDGLALGNQKTLSDVITVVTGELNVSAWRPSIEVRADGGLRWVRRSRTAAAFDYVYRLPLSYDTLRSLDTDSIKDWAASARLHELHHVLGRLANAAMRHDYTLSTLPEAAADGWGQQRCLAFKDAPGATPITDVLATSMDWEGPIRVDMATPRRPIQALIFRLGGGPFVRRPADLTLGWIPGTGMGADLVLTEQLQLVKATERTIIGIRLVSS